MCSLGYKWQFDYEIKSHSDQLPEALASLLNINCALILYRVTVHEKIKQVSFSRNAVYMYRYIILTDNVPYLMFPRDLETFKGRQITSSWKKGIISFVKIGFDFFLIMKHNFWPYFSMLSFYLNFTKWLTMKTTILISSLKWTQFCSMDSRDRPFTK